MSIVIVNWLGGSNDFFSYVNNDIKNTFEEIGKTARIINIGDQFFNELLDENKKGIDFAFTFQGLGSGLQLNSANSIWEDLQIPLLCYHGDHPALYPINHNASSAWIKHIYSTPSFTSFANAYIPRHEPATFLEPPSFFAKKKIDLFIGDYFVLPKNLDDNLKTYQSWSDASLSQKVLIDFLGDADQAITAEFTNGNRTNHHDVIDQLLTPDVLSRIQQELIGQSATAIRFLIHNLLHKIYRNMVAEYTLLELADMPIKIYGRGWDRFKALNNPNHEFFEGTSLADSSFLYQSNYGILDIAPISDGLHDRTLRATANGSAFLTASSWPHTTRLDQDFSDIFFDGTPGNLYSKAEWIIKSPNLHREKCQYFAERHHEKFPFAGFLMSLTEIAADLNKRQRST